MSSHQVFTLETVSIHLGLLPDVLRALIHTIVFQRSVGYVKPMEIEVESIPGLLYVRNDDPSLDALVEEKIALFCRALETTVNVPEHVQVIVTFFERHVRKGIFGKSEERVTFEQWVLPFQLVHMQNVAASAMNRSPGSTLNQLISKRMLEIVRLSDTKKDHLPPITVLEGSKSTVYPFDVQMPGVDALLAQSQQGGSDMSFFRRLVRGANAT